MATIDESREVYFIRAERLGLVKIGVANDARTRLRGLAMSSPDRLWVLGVALCHRGGTLEKELHRQFAQFRLHGEWFTPSRELLDTALMHSFNRDRMRVLQAYLDLPTMPHGRPSRATMERIRHAIRKTPEKPATIYDP